VLSRNLEKSLHRALAHASERQHEYVTLEHLLLALTEDQDVVAVLGACSVDLDRLRGEVLHYVDNEHVNLLATHRDDAEPTASFQRVLQRAAIHVQSSGREQVTGANVLLAMFAERESHAVHFLQEQGLTRYDAVNYISHGIAKPPGPSDISRRQEEISRRQEETERAFRARFFRKEAIVADDSARTALPEEAATNSIGLTVAEAEAQILETMKRLCKPCERAAMRAALTDAGALCDAIAHDILRAHGLSGEQRTIRLDAVVMTATRCAKAIYALRDKLEVAK
jgi:ATP-dependent Clp protease ATP-binding subunit ClpA